MNMPWKYTDNGSRTPYPRRGYTIDTWANGFGVWHAQAIFGSGLGNTGEAERIKHNALANLKRTIRKEIQERQGARVARLLYEVSDNYVDAQNRLWSITVREKI